MREQDVKRRIAEDFAARSVQGQGIEQDVEKLKHMLSTDMRDSIPPQIYELIAVVADRIRQNLEGK